MSRFAPVCQSAFKLFQFFLSPFNRSSVLINSVPINHFFLFFLFWLVILKIYSSAILNGFLAFFFYLFFFSSLRCNTFRFLINVLRDCQVFKKFSISTAREEIHFFFFSRSGEFGKLPSSRRYGAVFDLYDSADVEKFIRDEEKKKKKIKILSLVIVSDAGETTILSINF